MMNRLTLIFIVLCFIFALTACSSAAETSPEVVDSRETPFETVAADPRIIVVEAAPEENGECHKACQLTLVKAYFEALDQIYRMNSTEEDIDNLFTFFHDEVKYEHIEYGANFDKDAWRAAFSNNLNRGMYTKEETEKIGIINVIHGQTHLAVEYAYGKEDENLNWKQEGEGLLIIFGFEGDEIILVKEYW